MMRLSFLLPILFALISFSPCTAGIFVGDKQYRFCQYGGCSGGNQDNNKPPTGLPVTEGGDGYRIVYIEYRDDGTRWDGAEFDAATKLIEDTRKSVCDHPDHNRADLQRACLSRYGGPITLFAYVHGWKNNANIRKDPKDPGDVEKFRAYLKAYASIVRPERARPVIGVYFGWHGRSLELPTFINWISFWTSSARALSVGNGGQVTKDLDRLATLAREQGKISNGDPVGPKENLQQLEPSGEEKLEDSDIRSRVIVLSHSFGARVLQTALLGTASDSAAGVVSGICKGLVHGQAQRPPVDVIIFENAATGAGAIWKTFDNCQPCGGAEYTAAPNGIAPGTDFPVCNGRTNGGDFSNTVMVRSPSFDKPDCRLHPERETCQPYPLVVSVSSKQDLLTRVVLFLAAGEHPAPFLPWLQSHRVDRRDGQQTVDRKAGEVFLFESQDSTQPTTRHVFLVQRKHRRISPANAIWTIKVDGAIVKDHGDVWNYSLMNFEINLITSTDVNKARDFVSYDDLLNRVTQPMCTSCTGAIVPITGNVAAPAFLP